MTCTQVVLLVIAIGCLVIAITSVCLAQANCRRLSTLFCLLFVAKVLEVKHKGVPCPSLGLTHGGRPGVVLDPDTP